MDWGIRISPSFLHPIWGIRISQSHLLLKWTVCQTSNWAWAIFPFSSYFSVSNPISIIHCWSSLWCVHDFDNIDADDEHNKLVSNTDTGTQSRSRVMCRSDRRRGRYQSCTNILIIRMTLAPISEHSNMLLMLVYIQIKTKPKHVSLSWAEKSLSL